MIGFEVLATGPLATIQDMGRAGCAHLGVGASGAADPAALSLGNRLLANDPGAAGIEVTFGGLTIRADSGVLIALTGAPCPATINGKGIGFNAPTWIPAGGELALGLPESGLRSYLSFRGGIDVPAVVGSRSTDVLAGLGPTPLRVGDQIPVHAAPAAVAEVDIAPVFGPTNDEVSLQVMRGPRDDWFVSDAVRSLTSAAYVATSESNRVGIRLTGPELIRSREDELPSEGMVIGALQVPPSGQPTLLLADHPLTGGYPVIAVVVSADISRAAQVRPGQPIRFKEVR